MATAIEYGLIAALIAVGSIVALEQCSQEQKIPANIAMSSPAPKTEVSAKLTDEPYQLAWYEMQEKPKSLNGVLIAERTGRNEVSSYWKGHFADPKTCAVLKSAKLTCDYNTRMTLSTFLTVNGKGLFPASGGTNPYYSAADRAQELEIHADHGWPMPIDEAFIGHPPQNQMLAAAVRRNLRLFQDGDLTAEEVRTRWR